MPSAGRLGDLSFVPHDQHHCPACPHVCVGPAVQGSGNVRINGRPALRVGDHGIHAACCGTNLWSASVGSKTVFINGKNAHRVTDIDAHCGALAYGFLITGSTNVHIGGPPDLGGFALGFLAGQMGKLATGPLAHLVDGIQAELLRASTILAHTVAGALGGALSGAVAGAFTAVVRGGNPLAGALGGAEGGATEGALSGAIEGVRQKLVPPTPHPLPELKPPAFDSEGNPIAESVVVAAGIHNPAGTDFTDYRRAVALLGVDPESVIVLPNNQGALQAGAVNAQQATDIKGSLDQSAASGTPKVYMTFSNGVNGFADALTQGAAIDGIDRIIVVAPAAGDMARLQAIAATGKPVTVLFAPSDFWLQAGSAFAGVDRQAVSDFVSGDHPANVTTATLQGPVMHDLNAYLDAYYRQLHGLPNPPSSGSDGADAAARNPRRKPKGR